MGWDGDEDAAGWQTCRLLTVAGRVLSIRSKPAFRFLYLTSSPYLRLLLDWLILTNHILNYSNALAQYIYILSDRLFCGVERVEGDTSLR
jgi:hypothetical protein